MNNGLCYCGNQIEYVSCCKRIKSQGASNPEQLMRSRYSAFVTGDIEYLVRELEENCRALTWLSLFVISSSEQGDRGEVEFVAYAQQGSQCVDLHERSAFIKEDGKWHYVNGEVLPYYPRDPEGLCWCGCGKKLKQCRLI